MSVTNNIRDNVVYKDETGEWFEFELSNDDIIEKLQAEKKKAFLSFAYGVWTTAWARDALLRRLIDIKDENGNVIQKGLDEWAVYMDTDSLKLLPGYDKNIFINYNNSVRKRIEFVSKSLDIPMEKYEPEDIKGKKHLLGLFEFEEKYGSFVTQGAKKYATETDGKIKITVAGVPKSGAKALKSLKDFKDDFVFKHEDTGKNLVYYCENQEPFILTDYLGNKFEVKDKTGCCIVPTTYVLGKAEDYSILVSDSSSKRAVYKE